MITFTSVLLVVASYRALMIVASLRLTSAHLAHEEVHSLEVNEIHLFLLIVVVEEFFK